MRSMVRVGGAGKGRGVSAARSSAEAAVRQGLDSRIELIQALIPLGLQAVNDVLQQEVMQLAGQRYGRGDGQAGCVRWGAQPGSVYLGDQKVRIRVPRVRDLRAGREAPLPAYQALRAPRRADEAALRKVLKGLSCREYEACVEPLAETFGLSGSSISRRFKRASARRLAELSERNLSGYDLVAIFLDGKTFGEDQMVTGLGVTLEGEKVVLGFVQTATENEAVCSAFLRGLAERGLKFEQGLLCVIDGAKGLRKAVAKGLRKAVAKGLRKAVEKVFGTAAAVQRCQWHKRENVVGYLPAAAQPVFRRKLQTAYEQPTYAGAKRA